MAEDAGSIYSEVRIKIDQLQKDIATAVSVMDRFGQKVVDTANVASNLFSNSYSKSIKQVESYVKSLDKAVAEGALTQRQAINSALEARKEELAYIQATAAKKGGFTDQEIADTKRVKAEIASLTEQQKKLGSETEKASGSFKLLALAASTVVIATFRSLVTTSSAYSEAMGELRAATKGSSEELDGLAVAAETAGKSVAASTTQAVEAEVALAKAGVSTANIMGGALTGALTLAAAGSMAVADAAEIAAATMTQFGLAGADVTHIADLLAAGAGKAQGEVSDLSMALKQAGLVASQTGLSVDDTVGSLAAFASAGLLGSDAGTSFRTMLLRLTPQSKEAAEEMAKLGINAFDAKGEFIGVTKFAGQLQKQLSGLTTEQRNSAMATIFGSDSIRAANILYTQGEKGLQGWIDKVNDQGYAAETARIKLDNLSGDLKKLDAQVATSSAKIGKSLDPSLRGLAQAGTAFLDFLDEVPAPVAAFATAAGTLAAGIAAVTLGVGFLTPALAALGVTVSAAFGPIALIVGGIAALTGGIVAASAAMDKAHTDELVRDFEALGKASGVSGANMEDFAKKAEKGRKQIEGLAKYADEMEFTAKQFEQIAKNAGLTNDQLADVVLKSDKSSTAMKGVAAQFVNAERATKQFAIEQAKTWAAMDERGAYELKKMGKTPEVIKNITSATRTLSQEIEYQNYLVTSGAKSEEDGIKSRLSLYQAELDRIEKKGAETGKADTAEMARLNTLIAKEQARQTELSTQDAKRKKDLEDYQKLQEKVANDGLTTEERITKAKEEESRKRLAAQIAANDEQIANTTSMNLDLIDLDTLTTEQLIALNEKLAMERADADAQSLKNLQSYADKSVEIAQALINVLSAVFDGYYQAQEDALDAQYAKEQELIEYNGLTKQQYLEQAVEDAKASGDAETIAEAEKQLALYELEQEYTKKKAELEYQAAMSAWTMQVAMATAQAAQATLAAYSSTAAIPIVGPGLAPGAAILAGSVGALQVAAVLAAMPQAPKFETGGIVLGTSYTGDRVPALVNSGEMILNADQQKQLFDIANGAGSTGGSTATVQIVLDSRVIAESTIKLVNNGIVKLKAV